VRLGVRWDDLADDWIFGADPDDWPCRANFVNACLFLLCPNARTAEMLTEDEARRIASNIAKLPTLLSKALPDDAVNNLSDERHEAEVTTPE